MFRRAATLGCILIGIVSSAGAEILSIRGVCVVELRQAQLGTETDFIRVTETFPTTDTQLPIIAFGQLFDAVEPDAAAAAAGAQLADPILSSEANPRETAIDVALNSLVANNNHIVDAQVTETREIRFSANELGFGSAAGDQETLTGRLFIDGVLGVFAERESAILDDVRVTLNVEVIQRRGDTAVTVFSGSVGLHGGTETGIGAVPGGSFPTGQLSTSDLSAVTTDLGIIQVLIIPGIQIDYEYDVTVGETFELETIMRVTGANAPGESGIVAGIGNSLDQLSNILALSETPATVAKVVNAVTREREDARTQQSESQVVTTLNPCQFTGFAALIGLVALTLLSARPQRRRVR